MKKFNRHLSHTMLAIFLFIANYSSAQEMLGVSFSLYSGISTAAINPALLTGTRVYMDVNIFGGNVSLANNMLYFEPTNRTISKAINLDTNFFKSGTYEYGRSYTCYDNQDEKYLTSSVKLTGPSMMLQAGRHAFGFTTNIRSFNSGNQIPYHMVHAFYHGTKHEPLHNKNFIEDKYSFVSMTWSELGLSYAYNLYDLFSNRVTIGFTAKALFGYEGGYMIMHNTNYTILDSKTVDFKSVDAEIGFAIPMSYENEYATDFGPLVKGYGAGFDVGIAFTKMKSSYTLKGEDRLCARPYNDFVYKIGLSLLDVGSITFTKDTELHKFDNVSAYWEQIDTVRFRGIHDALETYSKGFAGDPNASYSGDRIKVFLPATVSLQFDYHLKRYLFVSALWMHPVKFNDRTPWRPSQVAVVPRYENRYLGVSIPVSLFNYSEPRIGLAVRVYSFTIGTDRIGSLLGISSFNGMDFYFSFHFNIGKGACMSYDRGACSNRKFGSDW